MDKNKSVLRDEKEAAEYLDNKISVATLRYWRHKKIGPVFCRLGGRVLYPEDELDNFISSSIVRPGI